MGTLWSQERPPEEGQPTEQSRWGATARWLLRAVLVLGLLLGSTLLFVYILRSCGPRSCEMPECWHLLDQYLVSGNSSVAPCTDFFRFACETANGTSNSFQALAEENKRRLRGVLEAPRSWHPAPGEEKAFQFYSSCMDTDAIEAAGAGPLRQVIEELGGWPVSGNWTSLDFNQTLRLLMSQYDHFPFFRAYLGPHPTPPHMPVIQIDQPEFDIPLKQEQEQKVYAQILREYLAYLIKLGTLLGGDPGKVQHHASWSISITSQLIQLLRPLGQRRAQMVTVDQLQEMAPVIDWLSCLQATFIPMSLSPSQTVVVHDLDYLKNLSELVEKQLLRHRAWALLHSNRAAAASRDALRGNRPAFRDCLQSHMIFGLVGTLSPALDSNFQEARRLLSQKIQELTEWPPVPASPRWMKCVEDTGTFFEPTLAALFVREAFSSVMQSAAMDLFTAIKDALFTRLGRLSWMDAEMRKKAQDRVSQLQVKMGATEWTLEPALAGQEYSDVHLGPSFLQSFLSGLRSRRARIIQNSLQPSPHHRWQISPWGVKAYYSISDHVVVFPAGLLQPPFFHPAYPRAVNFGAAGSIMARELLHIFDQLFLPGGCPACDTDTLKGALLCLERQYAAFPLNGGTSFNGSHMVLENAAADLGALAIALQAYNKRLLWRRGETTLPNQSLNPQQLFFRSYAQVMCRDLSTQDSRDTHSPPTLRVHGPLSNTPAFARHFHCPHGATLNPSHRCRLW